MNLQYNNRTIRLVKDILFVALAVFLLTRPSIWAILFGALFAFWYGRDAYYQAKALWQEKHYKPKDTAPKPGPSQPSQTDDGKITVTDLSDVKEVDYKKE